jgi:hypothetical protein|eukprot:COSAG01_NODE_825_length_13294_cov_30.659038_11_plen_353_part_00
MVVGGTAPDETGVWRALGCCELYDFCTDEWYTLSALTQPRAGPVVASYDGVIVVAGGSSRGRPLDSTETLEAKWHSSDDAVVLLSHKDKAVDAAKASAAATATVAAAPAPQNLQYESNTNSTLWRQASTATTPAANAAAMQRLHAWQKRVRDLSVYNWHSRATMTSRRQGCQGALVRKPHWDLTVDVYGFRGCTQPGTSPWVLEQSTPVAVLPFALGSDLLRALRASVASTKSSGGLSVDAALAAGVSPFQLGDGDAEWLLRKQLNWSRLLGFPVPDGVSTGSYPAGPGGDLGGILLLSECRLVHAAGIPGQRRHFGEHSSPLCSADENEFALKNELRQLKGLQDNSIVQVR